MVKTREEIYAEAERSRARKADILRRRQEKGIDRARRLKRLRDRDAKRTKAMAEKRAAEAEKRRKAERKRKGEAARQGQDLELRRFRAKIKQQANQAVWLAIRAGALTRGPCADCGSTECIDAHHNDYRLPLTVVWLCRKCHRALHGRNRNRQWGLENIGRNRKKIENAVHSPVPESLLNCSCIDTDGHGAQRAQTAQDTKAGGISLNSADAVFLEEGEIVRAENEERP